MLGRKLPECRTGDTLLPGAYRLDEAREALVTVKCLSGHGVERLMSIYGGRAIGLVELAKSEPSLLETIDTRQSVLAAEVVFAIREEMARTLCDIVHRRLMVGLSADQGRGLHTTLATIAANEVGWSDERRAAELDSLIEFSNSFT